MRFFKLLFFAGGFFFSSFSFGQCDFTSGGSGVFSTIFPLGGLTNGDVLCIQNGDVVTVNAGSTDYSSILNLEIVIQSGGELQLVGIGANLHLGTGSLITVDGGGQLTSIPNFFIDLNSIFIDGGGFAYSPLLGDPNPVPGPASVTSGGGTVPIVLVYFDGNAAMDQIELSWATAYEANFSHFEVEKSSDGADFQSIGFLNSKGGLEKFTEYSFSDPLPLTGFNYYRLKAIDFDGSFEYSKIVNIQSDRLSPQVRVFPNPVTDRFKLALNFEPGSSGAMMLIDQGGNVVYTSNIHSFTSEIILPDYIKNGSYVLHLKIEEFTTSTRIIIE